ncbi:MAG: sulfite exporter TauE/SafE family protein [Aestuariivirga sp.]
MYFWQGVLLVIAGVFGGMANAMAGGASLFTFPAMLSTGLPPIVANASNAFSLLPANSLAAYLDREKLPERNGGFWMALASAVIGGVLGAFLLLFTPAKFFTALVPALIGLATLMFIFSAQIRKGLSLLLEGTEHPRLRTALVFLSGIYAGYFGAGVGVIIMAVLAATAAWELRTTNALKNVLGFAGNSAGTVIFIWQGVIAWPETFTMMVGTAVGGYLGVLLVKVLPSTLVRNMISAAGIAMTAIYVYRFWL